MQQLPSRDIVLIGGGHTNLHVVREWARSPVADCRLTLVSATPFATYSGMLPGCLAGLYHPDEILIDLQRLTQAVGARLVIAPAMRLDADRREVVFESRPPIRFDAASVGTGSVPSGLATASGHSGLVPVKPMSAFLSRLDAMAAAVDRDPVRVAVAGGGAAGVEVAFCIRRWWERRGRRADIRLLESGEEILPGFRQGTITVARRELNRRGITVMTEHRVSGCEGRRIDFEDAASLEADLLLWCVGAASGDFPVRTGLPLSSRGFVSIRPTLLSVSGHPVFAVGDAAEMDDHPLPRAGVYAVRQGPILFENLRRLLSGSPLISWRPQSDFLRLLATGDGSAVGQYRRLAGCSRWLWRLKDFIDTRFMNMHRPEANRMLAMSGGMAASASSDAKSSADGMAAMRCTGCGGKTSPRVLADVLRELRADRGPSSDDGFLQFGDAALLPAAAGPVDAVSVDFFEAFLDDPWIVGRVAAVHALSDLWASGTQATAAVALVTLPEGSAVQQHQMLRDVLAGAIAEFDRCGVVLAGGHTVDGETLAVGFTVLGRTAEQTPFRKSGLRPGQALILTKPLGTGAILAAAMRNETDVRSVQAALQVMLQSNESAAAAAHAAELQSVTDVTGFGLAGHLFEMLDASGVAAELDPAAIPLIPGAADCFIRGVRSSLDPDNRHVAPRIRTANAAIRETPVFHALFDPQTSGGLLLGVDADRADPLVGDLQSRGCEQACRIGNVVDPDAAGRTLDGSGWLRLEFLNRQGSHASDGR